MQSKPYLTVKQSANDEFVEKKSRFIGYVCPVDTEQDAIDFVNSIKKRHADARHNVYAYVVREGNKQRYSDDGEPQGTAGMPVLEVLLKEGLTDCAVVVTRYFGGILLGTGGLTRAYTRGAKIAVDAGIKVEMTPCSVCSLVCGYDMLETVRNLIEREGAVVTDVEYTDKVCVNFYSKSELCENIRKQLAEATAGRVDFQINGEKYMPIEINI